MGEEFKLEEIVPVAKELLSALKGMSKAADEVAGEFIKNEKAANWGVINEAYMAQTAAIKKAEDLGL